MKKTLIAALALVVLMMMTGTASALTTVDLIADGGDALTEVDVGEVEVEIVGLNLVVTFTTTDDWEITATHLGVKTVEYDGINMKPNGNVSPGKFTAGAGKTGVEHDSLTTYTYNIPLIPLFPDSGLPVGPFDVDVAAHADVRFWENAGLDGISDNDDDVYREETAWGEGDQFAPDRNWAMYIEIQLELELVE